VEDVAGRLERVRHARRLAEVEQRGERQPHVAPFVGDGSAAEPAGHLAGQNPLGPNEAGVVEPQMLDARAGPAVELVKYGRPWHRGAVQLAADGAVTELGIQRIGGHPVPHRAAVAGGMMFRDRAGVASRLIEGTEIRGSGELRELYRSPQRV